MDDDILVAQRGCCDIVRQCFALLTHQRTAGSDDSDLFIQRQNPDEAGQYARQQDVVIEQGLDVLATSFLDTGGQISAARHSSLVSVIPEILYFSFIDQLPEQIVYVIRGAIVPHHNLVIRKILHQQAIERGLKILCPECRNHH
ncbi:MAG: hypothetical protein WBF84_12235 [Castellaniella sp.]